MRAMVLCNCKDNKAVVPPTMDSYLDTNKSIIISAPAGSGKTEKLARRYIALLQKGVDAERILAITFTDKAAAEMKQRILRILKDEDPGLYAALLDRMPLMRVSTIHSFCGTLLRRFSFEAGIDPAYRVEDAIDSRMVWEEILYEVLMEAGAGDRGHEFLLQTLGEKGFGGLDYLKKTLDYLYQKNPFSLEAGIFPHVPCTGGTLTEELRKWPGAREAIEDYDSFFEKRSCDRTVSMERLFLTDRKEPRKRPVPLLKNMPDYRGWAAGMYACWKDRKLGEYAERTARIREIFSKCVEKYTEWKKSRGTLDFSDLEYLAYRMLTGNPEWANILYAFDEKTDHILVDEFQDTNTFQWEIINKLTEEWRSGMGAKREEGTRPTMFFVGDEKQSIYFFRGANVEIFHGAREKLSAWLGEEFSFEEIRDNFRSRPVIVEFTNRVFSEIMKPGGGYPWRTEYSPFRAFRAGMPDAGHVEIILPDREAETVREAKHTEAELLAMRIRGLAGNFPVADKDRHQQRPCRYMDMAVLLRKRTHLEIYEEALRKFGIPYVAVKGIGFYQEPEVAMLRALIFFLSDPRDDYSLYILLKSPLFNLEEGDIIRLVSLEGDCLFSKLGNGPWKEAAGLLREWLSQAAYTPLAELAGNALVATKAWRHFHEDQRAANIRKFIRIIEDQEARGRSLQRIRDFLERTYTREEEPKANVNTEGMNAVRIMTIHAAKGLEFPIVFIPGLEEPFTSGTGDCLVYEKEGRFLFKSIPEPSIRRQDEDFLIHQAKEEEEQKRLFYVAVTRAEEALFLMGHWSERDRNFLSYLKRGLGLEKREAAYVTGCDIQGLSVLTEDDVKLLFERAPEIKPPETAPPPAGVVPLTFQRRAPWKAVTETVDIRRRHGRDSLVIGDIMHAIFEGISKGIIREQDIDMRIERLLSFRGISRQQGEGMAEIIRRDISTLKDSGIWQDIILPRENAFTELPFILEHEGTVYTGRIDRIIMDGDTCRIYDYKTFPAGEEELPYLLRQYAAQLDIYRKAAARLFTAKHVKTFIVFTHTGEIHEV